MQILVYPMAFYLFYVVALVLINFKVRKKAVLSNQADFRYYKSYSDKSKVPRHLLIWERHVDHQFQVPVVFLVTGVAQMQVLEESSVTVSLTLAWLFVISRLIHSFIHLGSNKIFFRASAYAFGGFILITMWLQMLIHISQRP